MLYDPSLKNGERENKHLFFSRTKEYLRQTAFVKKRLAQFTVLEVQVPNKAWVEKNLGDTCSDSAEYPNSS